MFSQCTKEAVQEQKLFGTRLSISPASDTVKTGDTLWLEMIVPAHFYDNVFKHQVALTDTTNLAFSIGFHHVTHKAPHTDTYLQFADPLGNDMNPEKQEMTYRPMKLKRYPGHYLLKFGVVPIVAGAYAIDWGRSGSVYPKAGPFQVFEIALLNTDLHEKLATGPTETKRYYFYAR
ncbi:hypothetical protein MKQ68_15490 [Chitinophaga horti]|uniref:Wzt C-terminal domain-containing protein n=1 Tax=Chitinophaga horti TaxID=2920382 RepID=A0ABY6IVU4_9BACT|nr:hypothetical protein [Chitinophaga horti]UYQ91493.1 hypothetical protein MKQ68_15490 [Chitinophaga horti]